MGRLQAEASQGRDRLGAFIWGRFLLSVCLFLVGCVPLVRSTAQTATQGLESSGRGSPAQGDIPAVEAETAAIGSIGTALDYVGTTRPVRSVTVRARVEGQIVGLSGDVGDRVQSGDSLAQLDGDLLSVAVIEARSELAALKSEIAQAQALVSDAQTAVVQAQANLNQAQVDAERLQRLAEAGASSQQAVEQALLALETTRQAIRSAQEQVSSRQQSVISAEGRFKAQQAVVDQSQQRLTYAGLTAPIGGVILSRFVDLGDYVQTGTDLFSLGDLSSLTVMIQVSEFDLNQVALGLPAQVRLDAFPDQLFSGRVTRIVPLVDETSRLIPVEISMANLENPVGSGLMARVQLDPGDSRQVVVPDQALTFAQESETPMLFVLKQSGEQATVMARLVTLGQRGRGQVEILSGLKPGETYIRNSDTPLEDGQTVRLSILSEVNP